MYVLDGSEKVFDCSVEIMTKEKQIILSGSLINYYKNKK